MVNPTGIRIISLTQTYASKRANDILALEHNWIEIGDEPWSVNNLMHELPLKWELSHVALHEGNIIGYQIGCLRDVRHGLPTYLINTVNGRVMQPQLKKLVVDKESRGLGVGRKLLRPFLEKLLERDYDRVFFRVRIDNPAVRFYDKLGFFPEKEIDRTCPDGVESYFYNIVINEVLQNV